MGVYDVTNKFRHHAIRGFLANTSQRPPLLLTFQWNPTDVSENKSAKYTEMELGGYHAPVQLYSSGGSHSYSFSLFFDATPDTSSLNLFRVTLPLAGVQPAIQTLMSFLYPSTKNLLNTVDVGFGAPPKCHFGLGPRVVSGFIRNVQVSYSLYDRFLTPLRATCKVEFVEIEDGVEGKVNALFRRGMTALQLGRNI
jgi:hypothetical protein